jgi:hypothetical protein
MGKITEAFKRDILGLPWSTPARAEAKAYESLSQTAESPSASGSGGVDFRLNRAEDMEMVQAFLAVIMDEPDTARDTIRNLSSRDRALLSFTLDELSRIVSEEEDFRRTADRRRAREDRERSLEDIVEGHLRDI